MIRFCWKGIPLGHKPFSKGYRPMFGLSKGPTHRMDFFMSLNLSDYTSFEFTVSCCKCEVYDTRSLKGSCDCSELKIKICALEVQRVQDVQNDCKG